MTARPLLKESLFLLNLNGFSPLSRNALAKARAIFGVLLYGFFGVDVFLDLIFNFKGLKSLDVVAGFVGNFQIVAKLINMIVYRTKLRLVIQAIDGSFWKPEEQEKGVKEEIERVFRTVRKIMMVTAISYGFTAGSYFIKPLLFRNRELPVAVYFPRSTENIYVYISVYIYQFVSGWFVAIVSLLAFDCLFISLIVYIVYELKMIRYKLQRFCHETSAAEVDLLIDHHCLVLECIRSMNESYSTLLLQQFLTSTFLIFLCLFHIISDGFPPSFEQLMKPVPYLVSFGGMMFIYCYCGTFLTIESQNVAEAAYETKWWIRTQPEFRRKIQLLIQRAHKMEKLKAGGMFDLQLESFTSVINIAFSFITLAQAVLTRSSEKASTEMIL